MGKLNINETQLLQKRKYLKRNLGEHAELRLLSGQRKRKNDIMESGNYDSKTFHIISTKTERKKEQFDIYVTYTLVTTRILELKGYWEALSSILNYKQLTEMMWTLTVSIFG